MQRWGPEACAALDAERRGVLRVLGGPGTGKTTLLVDAAVAHIAAGVDPEAVLLLTPGRIATPARTAMTTALLRARPSGRPVIREPLVRTVHGYAFAVLGRAAQRSGGPPPRLLTGAEQDGIVRELLAGDLADGGGWPESLRPALGTDGFANELRNLLARCAERGIDPLTLQRLGRSAARPEWTAAGRFAQQYEQVMLLRAAVGTAAPQATMPALGAAELVGAALEAFEADPDLLAAEHARIRLLLVDDAQQLDPQAARLVRVLADGADASLLTGDPQQAVFGFRGADPGVLLAGDSPEVALSVSHRCAPAVARAITGIAGRLPGAGAGRVLDGVGDDAGSVRVQLAGSGHAEAALIADTLRRAHLIDGVPWSQMAVIVRSVPRAAARLPRALAAVGVPVLAPAAGRGSLSEQPAVHALLTVLAAVCDGLTVERALDLVTGPIGRVDPISLRQLRRILDRSATGDFGDRLVALLEGAEPDRLPERTSRALRRVRAVLHAAADGGGDPRYALWRAWHKSGLQQRWLVMSERGGTSGAQAGRDLDAVTALFDLTEQYVSRTAGASLPGLVDHVIALQLAPTQPEPAPHTEAVAVLSAHAALGREWDLVVIAGLQDGLWPNTVPRGGVLRTQQLLDRLDGIGANASARAPLLAEERRLLVSALGRARRRLVVTAVDGEAAGSAEMPSAFFAELAQFATAAADPTPVTVPPVLSVPAVVGRLRAVVCSSADAVDAATRASAATQLARLAKAGVAGADPAGWYGMLPDSTDEPLWDGPEHVVTLSPSTLQTLADCPLRWLAERHGGSDRRDLRSAIGSLLHALIAEPGRSDQQLLDALEHIWPRLPFEAPWYAANELARHRAVLLTFLEWRSATRGHLTEVGVEVGVDGVVDGVRLRGRVDRVERDAAGRLVIVDVKTAKSPATKDDAQRHPQLAAYQLAVAEGLLGDGEEPGGARLVYPAKPGAAGATEREQDALTPQARDEWRARLTQAAAATAGPMFVARVNDGCRHCPIRANCPAQTEPAP